MSRWNEIEDDGIEINHKDKEVEMYVGYDNLRSIYAVLTFKQIEEIYNKIKNAHPQT